MALTTTTLSKAMDAGSPSLVATSVSGVTPGMLAQIDTELMKVVSVSGNTVKVQRGQAGTIEAAHASGSPVTFGLSSDTFPDPTAINPLVTDFLPVMTIGGVSTGITYANRVFKYQRIGRFLVFAGVVQLSSKGGLAGPLVVLTMPFGNTLGTWSPCVVRCLNHTMTPQNFVGDIQADSSMVLQNDGSGFFGTQINDNFQVYWAGSYLVG